MGCGLVPFIQPVGIDQGQRHGQRRAAFMMIDHDNIDSGVACHGQRLECLRAAIDGDDQGRALARQPHQRLTGRAIAFHQPVGDIGFRRESEVAQQADEQGRTGGAIDVIIAKNAHILAPLHRVGQPFRGGIHVAEQAGVGHEGADRGVAVRIQRVARTAARQQQLRHQIVGRIARFARIRPLPPPFPGLASDGAGDVERKCHAAALVACMQGWKRGPSRRIARRTEPRQLLERIAALWPPSWLATRGA